LEQLGDAQAVELLIICLKDDDHSMRKFAAASLGQLGDTRAMEPLIACLEDSEWAVRSAAAEALGQLGDARAVDLLIGYLKDEDSEIRASAARGLAQLGDARSVVPLIVCLRDRECYVSWTAAGALGKLGDARAIEPLIDCLKGHSAGHLDLRVAAATALGQLGDTQAYEPLIACLQHSDSDVRRAAANALGQLGDTRAIEPLIDYLKNPSGDPSAAAEALIKLGEPAVGPLIAMLKESTTTTLAAYRDSGVYPYESAEDRFILDSAAKALGGLGDARAIEPLIAYLKYPRGSYWADGSSAAAEALIKLGEPAAGPLIACLKDSNVGVRLSAAMALGRIGDTRAVKPLIGCLKDTEEDVRAAAATALGQIGDHTAIGPLAAAMPDWPAKDNLGQALASLGWKPRTRRQQIYFWVCRAENVQLNAHWDEIEKILLDDAATGRVRLVENAVYTIVNLGREDAVADLVRILEKHGNKTMAEMYLNCGHGRLSDAARAWATRHGYTITAGGRQQARWGAWR
jgi:HEAT repeat protein